MAAEEKTMYLIRHLPLELREKIYKEFIAKTVKERNENGFESIHFSIKNAPYCSIKERITDIMMCKNCFENDLFLVNERCGYCHLEDVDQNYLCHLCNEEGTVHHINTDFFPERNFILLIDFERIHRLTRQKLLNELMFCSLTTAVSSLNKIFLSSLTQ